MTHVLGIHSYRGGTGKSTLAANLAYALARRGLRVAVVDTDVQAPALHLLFELDPARVTHTVTDFLMERCELEEAAYDMTAPLRLSRSHGKLYLVPASLSADAVLRVVDGGYDPAALQRGLRRIADDLALDHVVVDTHPGLNRQTLLTTALAEDVLLVARADASDSAGTGVLLEVLARLGVPRARVVLNAVPPGVDCAAARAEAQAALRAEVVLSLPYVEEVQRSGGRGLFLRAHSANGFSRAVRSLAAALGGAASEAEGSRPCGQRMSA